MRTQVRKKNHNITYGTMPEFILTFEVPMGNIVKLSPHRWSRYFATIEGDPRMKVPTTTQARNTPISVRNSRNCLQAAMKFLCCQADEFVGVCVLCCQEHRQNAVALFAYLPTIGAG